MHQQLFDGIIDVTLFDGVEGLDYWGSESVNLIEIFHFSHSCLIDAYNFTEVCACSLDEEEDCSVFNQVEK